jgi:flagellar assembly factor FliW
MTQLALMVHTTRFGDIEVAPEAVLHFPDGLIGLSGSDYALIPAGHGPFTWCQSMADPAVALPVTRPERFFPGFVLELGEAQSERLGDEAVARAEVFVTVRAAATAADCTANLRAPILVLEDGGSGARLAYQVVNQDPDAALRTPLFAAV